MTGLSRAKHARFRPPQQKISCVRALRSSTTGRWDIADLRVHVTVVDNCFYATFVLLYSRSLKCWPLSHSCLEEVPLYLRQCASTPFFAGVFAF